MTLQSQVQYWLDVVITGTLAHVKSKLRIHLLFFRINSMMRLTPLVKLAVEYGACGSSMYSRILEIVALETSSLDKALGPMTPASLELADIAIIAFRTSATVPCIYIASARQFA